MASPLTARCRCRSPSPFAVAIAVVESAGDDLRRRLPATATIYVDVADLRRRLPATATASGDRKLKIRLVNGSTATTRGGSARSYGLVKEGHVDQILLESHVPAFDGERVLRFRRSATGATEVDRGPSASPEEIEIRTQARKQGAEQRWVTRDGYTQLPDAMREDLGVGSGAHIWFLKKRDRWGAWREQELEQLFNPGAGSDDE